MNGDKRSVSTDALETLGTIIDENQRRDAIHVAVEPCRAGHTLQPGEHVARANGEIFGNAEYCGEDCNLLGIVDPFLAHPVRQGEYFWLLVYPRQITSLRHVWSHKDFLDEFEPDKTYTKEESEAWLRTFISGADCPDYDTVIAAASGQEIEPIRGYEKYGPAYRNDGEYLFFNGQDAHSKIPKEFWMHVENVTGIEIPTFKRAEYFSCSC